MKKMDIFRQAVVAGIAMSFAFAATASAQHLISTKAGFVNRVDGKVWIHRAGNQDDERGRASLGTQMRNGDTLSTAQGAYAEILLNPGSYLRLSEKGEVRAVNTSLQQVEFELISGSAILEVGEVEKLAPLQISTSSGRFFARKDGLYRFDVVNGVTHAAARQGELWIGTREEILAGKGTKLGRGREAVIGNDSPVDIAGASFPKIDKEKADDFDVWSFNRAQSLMFANNLALRQSRMNSSLAYGWLFDPFSGTYTFIPRRGTFWSPYGFSYFNSFGECFTCFGNPWSLYNMGFYGGRGNSGGAGSGGAGNASNASRVISGLDRTPVRREIEGRRVEYNPNILDAGAALGRGIDTASRSIAMPSPVGSSSPTVVAGPAPSRGSMGGGAPAGGGGGDAGGGRPAGPTRP